MLTLRTIWLDQGFNNLKYTGLQLSCAEYGCAQAACSRFAHRPLFAAERVKGLFVTTVSFVPKQCAVCGATNRQAEVGVRGLGEPEDLDLRPGGVHRSSIYMWIQRCMSCGYCSTDIAGPASGAAKVVQSREYKDQLTATNFPDTANAFLCWAKVLKARDRIVDAGWACIYAAWVCDDDVQFRDRAAECRIQAADLFTAAVERNQAIARTPAEELQLLADCYRRAGRFEEAAKFCARGRDASTTNLREQRIFLFEEELIEAQDSRHHAISEALEGDE